MDLSHYLPHLPAAFVRDTLGKVSAALPAPAPDTPEARARRDHFAFEVIAALHPTNTEALLLAVQYVLVDAEASEFLRLANQHHRDPAAVYAYRAKALKKMRESNRLRKRLLDIQRANPIRRPAPWSVAGLKPGLWNRHPQAPEPVGAPPIDARTKAERAARIRAMDLRVVETPATKH